MHTRIKIARTLGLLCLIVVVLSGIYRKPLPVTKLTPEISRYDLAQQHWLLYRNTQLGFQFYYPDTVQIEEVTRSLGNQLLAKPYILSLVFCSPPDLNLCRSWSHLYVEDLRHKASAAEPMYGYDAPILVSTGKVEINNYPATLKKVKNRWHDTVDTWIQLEQHNIRVTLRSIDKDSDGHVDDQAQALLFGFLHTFKWLNR